jgi:hypothetical protein
MDLRNALLKEHSRKQTDQIVKYIGDDPKKFNQLILLFLSSEEIIPQRASWVLSYCIEKYPALITPYLKKIISNLNNPVHDAVKRNTIRLLQHIQIPKSLYGITADICFKLLTNNKEPVAIKVFSMSVLHILSKEIPELQKELQLIIEDQLEYQSPAFTNRGKKIISSMSKKN